MDEKDFLIIVLKKCTQKRIKEIVKILYRNLCSFLYKHTRTSKASVFNLYGLKRDKQCD